LAVHPGLAAWFVGQWVAGNQQAPAVPPFYLIRAANGFIAVGGDAIFTAKEARCFSKTALGFFYRPSATLFARQEVPAKRKTQNTRSIG
jgi:hypothetical protein